MKISTILSSLYHMIPMPLPSGWPSMRKRPGFRFPVIALLGVIFFAAPTDIGRTKAFDKASEQKAECTILTITGTFLPTEARYKASGTCTVFAENSSDKHRSEFNNVSPLFSVELTGEGRYTYSTKATWEKIYVKPPISEGPVLGNGMVLGRESTMVCDQDPWRNPSGHPCQSVGHNWGPGLPPLTMTGPREGMKTITYFLLKYRPNIPATSAFSTSDLRMALNKEYQAARAARTPGEPEFPRFKKEQAMTGPQMGDILRQPTVVAPGDGTRVIQGQFAIQAKRPKVDDGVSAEVEFVWLDTPATNKPNPYVNRYPVGMDQLVKGMPVPEGVTRGQIGRWQVRVRVAQPTQGPWSDPVAFQLALTAPPKIQQQPGAFQQPSQSPPSQKPAAGVLGGSGGFRRQ